MAGFPLHGKSPVSADMAELLSAMGEMAERVKTKFGESCHENT